MCYNVKALLWSQLKRARLKGKYQDADAIQQELNLMGTGNYNYIAGFSHPNLLIYNYADAIPVPAAWGLIHSGIRDEKQKNEFWKNNYTLNAKGETIFTVDSFKESATSKHCLIYVDGFYEYHHFQGKKYPFFIQLKEEEPFPLAGLWAEWINPATNIKLISFAIVTTVGNKTLSKIHNNPDRDGPRMPIILDEARADEWLKPNFKRNSMAEFLKPFPDEYIKVHTVKPLSGKNVIKNNPTASDEFIYQDLKFEL